MSELYPKRPAQGFAIGAGVLLSIPLFIAAEHAGLLPTSKSATQDESYQASFSQAVDGPGQILPAINAPQPVEPKSLEYR